MTPGSKSVLAALTLVAGFGWAQPPAQPPDDSLTAREIFYASVESPVKVVKVKSAAARRPRTAAAPDSAGDSMSASNPAPAPRDSDADSNSGTLPGGARLIKAANVSESPLGLRYSLLEKQGGSFDEVDRDTVFHAKDSVRLSVESSGDAFLYIVNQGSSGNWKVLFPSAEIQGGDNHVLKGKKYEIPQGYSFTFDEQTGDEKLFIVLSRRVVPNLEKLIYEVGPKTPKKSSTPAASSAEPKTLMASAAVTNSMVSDLETVYSRDLIIEKVKDSEPPAKDPDKKRETAVYTVNPVGGADAKVVAQVTLKHR
jgi:hypothetical protein